jgi:hypothetical protein
VPVAFVAFVVVVEDALVVEDASVAFVASVEDASVLVSFGGVDTSSEEAFVDEDAFVDGTVVEVEVAFVVVDDTFVVRAFVVVE